VSANLGMGSYDFSSANVSGNVSPGRLGSEVTPQGRDVLAELGLQSPIGGIGMMARDNAGNPHISASPAYPVSDDPMISGAYPASNFGMGLAPAAAQSTQS
jgi:hypothetical protein